MPIGEQRALRSYDYLNEDKSLRYTREIALPLT